MNDDTIDAVSMAFHAAAREADEDGVRVLRDVHIDSVSLHTDGGGLPHTGWTLLADGNVMPYGVIDDLSGKWRSYIDAVVAAARSMRRLPRHPEWGRPPHKRNVHRYGR